MTMTRRLPLLPTANHQELAEDCGYPRNEATAAAQISGGQLVFILESLLVAIRPTAPAVPAAPAPPEFMTVAEFAERLGVCERTVREMLKAGMPHVRPSPRVIRVRVALAERWLADETNRRSAARAMKLGTIAARRGRR